MTLNATQNVFELVLARPVVTAMGEHRALVHLWWSAPQQGNRLVQVYVDGTLTETSHDPGQRELWLMCDRSRGHRVELLAVDAADPDTLTREHPELLNSWDPPINGELSLSLIRDLRLPVDTRVVIEVDGQQVAEEPMWPATEHRGGFGAVFGEGEFGYDAVTGPGLGRGELGMGPLGSDGTAWNWRSSAINVGSHTVDVMALDSSGQVLVNNVSTTDVVVDSLPAPAASFSIDPDFTLRWTN